MAFNIRMGLPEMEAFWRDLSTRKQQGKRQTGHRLCALGNRRRLLRSGRSRIRARVDGALTLGAPPLWFCPCPHESATLF